MLSDIEIAQACEMLPITEVADRLGIENKDLEQYGRYKAKVDLSLLDEHAEHEGKLILVTAITPTPAGEGKTTTAIGLADGLRRIGKNAVIAMREPSLGPVFGIKGGACGGGRAQVVPMEDINLHFTGDIHAIGAANNLLAAILDNHIYQGNTLGIDPESITWTRCVDMNDRQLRCVRDGLGGRTGGVPRDDRFEITVATETMAIFCMASSIDDLKVRLARIIVSYTYDGKPVTAGDLKAVGAMAALLKDAIKPNLVQTLEGTPAFVHGGPFANIAHGCNSVTATRMAMRLGDYAVTEAGFGAANMKDVYGLPTVVAINRFPTDTEAELELVRERCRELGVEAALSDVWAQGGAGGTELAEAVVKLCEQPGDFRFAYGLDGSIEDKLRAVVQRVYRGRDIEVLPEASAQINRLTALGMAHMPVCIAKTQYSFSDDKTKLGAPEDFTVTVREVKVSAGAGFIVALTGDVLTMPGLPKLPAAERIDVDSTGKISGLF